MNGCSGTSTITWSISGDGSIIGSNTGTSVNVQANSLCGGSYNLVANVSCSCLDGNTYTTSCSRTINITAADFTLPDNPAPVVVPCASAITMPAPPSVNDNCGNPITPSGPAVGGTYAGCEGTITYTYTYQDCEGNSHDWVYTYTIEREEFTVPGNQGSAVACASSITAPVPPTVTDNCGNTIVPTGPVISSTGTDCYGTKNYTWTYTDCEGNTHDWKYTYNINDNVAPVLSGCPNDASYQCITDVPGPANVTALDNCSGVVVPIFAEVQSNPGSSCNNVITRTWTVTDACGNPASCTQKITVNDITKPVLVRPADVVVGQGQPVNIGTPSATDNCDQSVTITNNAPATFPLGGTWITWVATDDCNNSVAKMQKVTVNPLPTCSIATPAALPLCGNTGNTLTVTTNGSSYAWTVTSSDNSWKITAGSTTKTITYTAGTGGVSGTFTVVVTNSTTGCSSTCSITLGTRCEEHCGYTQGFYGGTGKTCSQNTVQQIMPGLLTPNLVVGCNTRTITFASTDAACLISHMPAGSTADALLELLYRLCR